jgi:hypothetical protein
MKRDLEIEAVIGLKGTLQALSWALTGFQGE